MPDGRVHTKLTLGLQLVTVPSVFILSPTDFIGLQLGIVATYFVNPDLDITTNRLGIAKYFGFETYRKLVPHRFGLAKRHWNTSISNVLLFSHFPLIGTVVRTILVLLPLTVLLLLFNAIYILDIGFIFYLYLGMALSDLFHILADILVSSLKRGL